MKGMTARQAMLLAGAWLDRMFSDDSGAWAAHYSALRDYLETEDGTEDLAAGESFPVMMHRALAMRGSK